MPIEPDSLGARQTAWPEDYERTNASGCKEDPECASEKPQQSALRQTLAYQAAAARAECHAHCEFTFTRNRAGQLQAGHINAYDQQHDADRAEKQPECGPNISDQVLAKGKGLEAATGIRFRVLFSELITDDRKLGLGLNQRHAMEEEGHHVEEIRFPILHPRLRVFTQRRNPLGL